MRTIFTLLVGVVAMVCAGCEVDDTELTNHKTYTLYEEISALESVVYLVGCIRLILLYLYALAHIQTLVDDYLGCLVYGIVVNRNLILYGVLLDIVFDTLL